MSKPHIVFLVAEDWYFCLHWLPVAGAVRDAGYRVTVVTKVDQHADEIQTAGLTLAPFDLGRGRFNPATETARVFRLARLLRRLKPDLTHHIGIKAIATGSYAARQAGVGASINLFAGLGYLFASEQRRVRALRKVLRPLLAGPLKYRYSRVETLNQDDCDRLAADGWIDPERTTVLPGSGIDLERFTPMPPPENAVVTLAVVARMIRIKGIDLIVEAVRRAQAAGTPCRLLLVGKPDPANPSSYSVDDLQTWGSLPGIEWRGYVEDVRTIWQEADIAILASHGGEGVPVTLLESSACCRPAIATNTPGCRDIVLNNSTGLLVEPDNLLSLVDAAQVLVADKKKRLRFGLASRHLVETRFTSHRVASMILQDYDCLGLEP